MKKLYQSPQILFESFELSSSVAAGCGAIAKPNAAYMCPVKDPEIGLTIFTKETDCQLTSPGYYDRVCYNIPLENNSVFTS
ncbi:MAG: hypothetical protein ACI4VI_09650 [Acutalibacteraceae bacterium]